MLVSGLRISWATPAASWPTAAICSARSTSRSRCWSFSTTCSTCPTRVAICSCRLSRLPSSVSTISEYCLPELAGRVAYMDLHSAYGPGDGAGRSVAEEHPGPRPRRARRTPCRRPARGGPPGGRTRPFPSGRRCTGAGRCKARSPPCPGRSPGPRPRPSRAGRPAAGVRASAAGIFRTRPLSNPPSASRGPGRRTGSMSTKWSAIRLWRDSSPSGRSFTRSPRSMRLSSRSAAAPAALDVLAEHLGEGRLPAVEAHGRDGAERQQNDADEEDGPNVAEIDPTREHVSPFGSKAQGRPSLGFRWHPTTSVVFHFPLPSRTNTLMTSSPSPGVKRIGPASSLVMVSRDQSFTRPVLRAGLRGQRLHFAADRRRRPARRLRGQTPIEEDLARAVALDGLERASTR